MSQSESDTALSLRIFVMRILIFALVSGIVIFLAITVFLRLNNPRQPPNPNVPLISFLALGNAFANLLTYAIVPGLATTAGRRRIVRGPGWADPSARASDRIQLCALYQTRMIVGAAILEGAAFFLLIAYLLEGQVICLAAAVLFAALIAAKFPTQTGIANWMDKQAYLLDQERMGM
jgi:hypothetical protein